MVEAGELAVTLLETLTRGELQVEEIRRGHRALRDAKPLIRVWMNDPDPSKAGAKYVGRVDFDDSVRGSFPFKRNTPSEGILELRDDHYISMWLKTNNN